NNFIPETLDTIEMIKSFGAQKYMEEKYLNSLYASYRVTEKINFYDSVFSPIILVIKTLVISIVAVLSCSELNLIGISVGAVAAAIELISDIFKPIENLSMELQNIQGSMAGIKRCENFLNENDEPIKDISYLENINKYKEKEIIKFNNVSFCYEGGGGVIENFNLSIEKNENVTLLGRTGAGKSTCFKLILGLLQPTNGSVTLCGIDAFKIPNSEKRRIFGYVEQSFHSINGSIKDEITLGDERITAEEVEAALELV
ncbi:MAG: ABC transporter ATP-binding protein, partial [Oscillospiraceae bacterium]